MRLGERPTRLGSTNAYAADRARRLTERAENAGIPVRSFPGHAVIEPGEIVPDGRAAYRVFTPYHRAWVRAPGRPVVAPPRAIRVPRGLDPGRLPTPEGAGTKAIELPPGGETVGRKRMLRFVAEGAADYAVHRDDLEDDATSRLSGYLRFGCVSANELASRIRRVTGGGAFLRQLAWRDFFGQLLADHPEMAWEDLRGSGGGRQRVDDAVVDAWTSGRTGVPLVDAGMRQLLREGWMHNRARLVTASFSPSHSGSARSASPIARPGSSSGCGSRRSRRSGRCLLPAAGGGDERRPRDQQRGALLDRGPGVHRGLRRRPVPCVPALRGDRRSARRTPRRGQGISGIVSPSLPS